MNPERISPDYWLNCHLSIAIHYGQIMYNGVLYIVDDDNYLVREDIYKAEVKKANQEKKDRIKAQWQKQLKMF